MELSQKELAEIEGVTAKQICRRETERLTWKAKMKEEKNKCGLTSFRRPPETKKAQPLRAALFWVPHQREAAQLRSFSISFASNFFIFALPRK